MKKTGKIRTNNIKQNKRNYTYSTCSDNCCINYTSDNKH